MKRIRRFKRLRTASPQVAVAKKPRNAGRARRLGEVAALPPSRGW
jgi:hypothetical protein